MKTLNIILVFCVSLLFILPGCDSEHSNMTGLSNVFDERQMQTAPTQPSEDTYGSEISTQEYPEEIVTIVAVGDSLTFGIRSPRGGYPAMLQLMLSQAGYNAVVLNAGIPGETADDVHDRFLDEIAGADIVLLMVGANDLVNPSICQIPYTCRTLEYTERMLDEALISKVTPLLSTVTPACSTGPYDWMNSKVVYHNSQLHGIAQAKGVVVVDNYQAILISGGDRLYEDEKLHFTDEGYDVIAQQWFDALVLNGLLEQPEAEE